MAEIFYHAVPVDWRRDKKTAFLNQADQMDDVEWAMVTPDKRYNWLTDGLDVGFANLIPLGNKETKAFGGGIFRTFSNGVKSNSDPYVYNFAWETLSFRAKRMVEDYQLQLAQWKQRGCPKNIDDFLKVDESVLKWIRHTKKTLLRGEEIAFSSDLIRRILYRPFTLSYCYFERAFNEDTYQFAAIFPTSSQEDKNRVICASAVGNLKPFHCLMANHIVDLHLTGDSQCFPFYTYNEDGTNRRENIPDATQITFWKAYGGDESISKWDIFHYVYGVLHHPGYRTRFAANLKRELPRVPFAPDFRAFAEAGRKLAELHVGYETQPEFPLQRRENRDVPLDWRVERMRFSADKRALVYNEFLTLEGIPPEAFAYRLGNRSALEWVVDQYQVSTDARSGLVSDPNQPDDEKAIVRLLGQVISVSLETQRIVAGLPEDLGVEKES